MQMDRCITGGLAVGSITTRPRQRGGLLLHGVNDGVRTGLGDGQREYTRSRAQVQHYRRLASATFEERECPTHEQFGFRPRNEDTRPDSDVDVAHRRDSDDVLQRNPLHPLRNQLVERRDDLGIDQRNQPETRAFDPEQVGCQQLGVGAWAGHTCGVELFCSFDQRQTKWKSTHGYSLPRSTDTRFTEFPAGWRSVMVCIYSAARRASRSALPNASRSASSSPSSTASRLCDLNPMR